MLTWTPKESYQVYTPADFEKHFLKMAYVLGFQILEFLPFLFLLKEVSLSLFKKINLESENSAVVPFNCFVCPLFPVSSKVDAFLLGKNHHQ